MSPFSSTYVPNRTPSPLSRLQCHRVRLRGAIQPESPGLHGHQPCVSEPGLLRLAPERVDGAEQRC